MSTFKYIPSFDGVRALAVGLVLLFHNSTGVMQGGWVGVDLFFVLSGYLITSLLQHEYAATGKIALKNFYVRRGLRLAPPLLLCILLGTFLWPYTHAHAAENELVATLAGLFYFANLVSDPVLGPFRHLWSLAVEEHFYFIWPFFLSGFLLKLSRHRRIVYLALMILSLTAFRLYVLRAAPELKYGLLVLDSYRFTFCRLDAIFLGAMVALIAGKNKKAEYTAAAANLALTLVFCGLAVVLFSVSNVGPFIKGGGFIVTNALCLFTVIVAIKLPDHPLLSNGLVRWIGQRSYGIYIYHFPLFLALEGLRNPHNLANFLLITTLRLVLTVVVTELSFRWVEQPVLRLKQRYQPAAFVPVH